LKETYQLYGLDIAGSELSDYLPLMCEFVYAANWQGHEKEAAESLDLMLAVMEDGTYHLLKALEKSGSPRRRRRMSMINQFLWVIFPYVCLAVFVVGHIYRYRTDQFNWTAKSSEFIEKKQLKLGSLMFHLGIIPVIGGHFAGLVIPQSWMEAAGVSDHMYHIGAVYIGSAFGLLTLGGMILLTSRRFTIRNVRRLSSASDMIVNVLLLFIVFMGMYSTLVTNAVQPEFNYRESISVWFRNLFMLRPDAALMVNVPLSFKIHILAGFGIFALWPGAMAMKNQPNYQYQAEIEKLRDRFQFDFVSLALVQPAEDRFVLTWQYASGNMNDRYKRIVLHSGKGIAGIVFKTGKPMLIQNVNTDIESRDLFNYPIIVAEQLKSLGAIPLWEAARVQGVLLVGYRAENRLTQAAFDQFQEGLGKEFGAFHAGEVGQL
ncbi:hypothetical protein BGX30_013998, partial [Mortierella sp. GBA39]